MTFPGVNNNDMLRLMMELKGPLPPKTIRKHRQAYERLHLEPLFEDDGRFRQQELDPVTSTYPPHLCLFKSPCLSLYLL